jgi:hypothetical protein
MCKDISLLKKLGGTTGDLGINKSLSKVKKNRQVTYIAPLNRIPLLSSDPGGVL